MSQENVEIVQAAVDAINRGDWDAVFKDAAPSGCLYQGKQEALEAVGLSEQDARADSS